MSRRSSALQAFVRKELRHILRDRQTLYILLLLPLAQVIVFGFALRTDVHDIRIAFADPSPDHASAALRGRFAGNGRFEVVGTAPDVAALEPLFRRGQAEVPPLSCPRRATRATLLGGLLVTATGSQLLATQADLLAAAEQAEAEQAHCLSGPALLIRR